MDWSQEPEITDCSESAPLLEKVGRSEPRAIGPILPTYGSSYERGFTKPVSILKRPTKTKKKKETKVKISDELKKYDGPTLKPIPEIAEVKSEKPQQRTFTLGEFDYAFQSVLAAADNVIATEFRVDLVKICEKMGVDTEKANWHPMMELWRRWNYIMKQNYILKLADVLGISPDDKLELAQMDSSK